MSEQAAFDTWAIVELFGHNVIAGRVSEQIIGGVSSFRVDVPAAGEQPTFTKFFGGAVICAITPCGEAETQSAVKRLQVRPIQPYVIPDLSLPASDCDGGDKW